MQDYTVQLPEPIKSDIFKINNYNFLKKLSILSILIVLGYVLISIHSILLCALGVIILGVMYAHMIELQHQCLHGSAFTNSKMNKAIGILLGIPMFVSYTQYKLQHMEHHKKLGSENDIEFFNYNLENKDKSLALLFSAFNLGRYYKLVKNLLQNLAQKQSLNSKFSEKHNKLIKNEYIFIATTFLTVGLLSIINDSFFIVKAWIIPILLISEPVHFFVELPEHFNCEKTNRNIFSNTRTIIGSKFSFWFTNGNNFHVEHHLLPLAPIDKLPLIHSLYAKQMMHLNTTYFEFFKLAFLNLKMREAHV